ncbi:Cytosine/adenosine deaminase [Faunimonas pinastri]|uniref:Cytosine/adenosine deaminase n=1 Tax=Faunimonas pinastri TaxID=1855383 RepID=A0A1H9E1H3_9HYPH|nr:amidohydrolase family protein [Faunimonas pinastri]SEQ19515.1 Cytosine/adenosine deaminase [Faunimonas pinastri]
MSGASDQKAGTSLVRGRYLLLRALDDERVETLVDGAILQIEGRIAEIGAYAELRRQHPDVEVIGSADSLVIPGLVNTHHHVGMTPIQLGSPDLPLELWLTHQMRHRTPDPYFDTLYSAFELVASGVTAVQHLGRMQPAPVSGWTGSGTAVIKAYRDVGMRVSYACCTRDQHRLVYGDDETFIAGLPSELQDETRGLLARSHFRLEDFATDYLEPMIDRFGLRDDPLVRLWLAPINLERASDRMLTTTSELAQRYGIGIHLHLSETPYQKAFSHRRFGKSSVAHLAEIGFLGPHLTLGHGTWIEEGDFELLHRHGVCICHNASSNLRLKSGIAPVTEFVKRGISVALGIDEAGLNDDRDMLQEMRLVKHLHCAPGLDEIRLTPAQIFRMATENGARATGFGEEVGQLALGREADLVVLDYARMTQPYTSPAMSPLEVLIHRAKTEHVTATMIRGRVVYRDGQFAFVDRDETLAMLARELDAPATAEEERRASFSARILPHIKDFYRDWELPVSTPWYRLNGR